MKSFKFVLAALVLCAFVSCAKKPVVQKVPTGKPAAYARLVGNGEHQSISGNVLFYPWEDGTVVVANITGLPHNIFFALHVHTEKLDLADPGDFSTTGGHFNPTRAPHPEHIGDLPVMLSSGGSVFAVNYTNRFKVDEVIGRSVIVHNDADDFRSQPAGNSGARIAYGNIVTDDIANVSADFALPEVSARAVVKGNEENPDVKGEVCFYPYGDGSLVFSAIEGLPGDSFFALHIHTNELDLDDPGDFTSTGGHFNPYDAPHPFHVGDLPVLLANNGKVYSIQYTGRFTPEDVFGRSVIIHADADDFRSQPAGDSGKRIAYGNIVAE